MTTSHQIALTRQGNAIHLANPPLGHGTYGAVHAVIERTDTAAKVYRDWWWARAPKQQRDLRIRKLTAMTAMPAPGVGRHATVAWPTDTISPADDAQIAGYLMPRAPEGSVKLSQITRQRQGSDTARLAADLLIEAIEELHNQGIIIGDINADNFALSPQGELWLLDTDGWQFSEPDGFLHYAHGATDWYTHRSIFERISGTQPNCCNPRCPNVGQTHAPTPSCRPREPYHDRYGIDRLVTDLAGRPRRTRHL